MFRRDGGPEPAGHYEAEVNKGSINMAAFTRTLNDRWDRGWRLAHLYSHDDNTVMVWERRDG